jgi:hypothetical protein
MTRKVFFFFLAMVIFGYSCKTDEVAEKMAAEEAELLKYMEDYPDIEAVIPGQAYVKVNATHPEGLVPESGKSILINFTINFLYDNTLEYSSYAGDSNYSIYPSNYFRGGPELHSFVASIPFYDAIGKMREKETADIYLSSRHNIIPTELNFIPRKIHVELVKVINDLATYQESLVAGYLENEPNYTVDTIKITSTSDNDEYKVFYTILNRGSGSKISGTSVNTACKISYLLNGSKEVYVTTEDKNIFLSAGENINFYAKSNFMPDILEKMNKGGRARLFMPYKIYKGKDLLENEQRQLIIPDGSVVIIELTVK